MFDSGIPEALTRDQLLQLIKQKENLEKEIKALHDVLKSQNVGMDDALIDGEGYPRADIDVYQVRHARSNIRCKNNDLKSLMKTIEEGLHNLHSQARETAMDAESSTEIDKRQEVGVPFARVMAVVDNSPAHSAGLKQGDLVIKFGSVIKDNFTNLKNISDIAESSKNRNVEVIITRNGAQMNLKLMPCTWSGAGLIGFKIRPVSNDENVDR